MTIDEPSRNEWIIIIILTGLITSFGFYVVWEGLTFSPYYNIPKNATIYTSYIITTITSVHHESEILTSTHTIYQQCWKATLIHNSTMNVSEGSCDYVTPRGINP